MGVVFASLIKAFGQLADGAILRVLVKSLGVTVLVFAVFGAGLYAALVWGFAQMDMEGGGLAGAAAAALIAGIAALLLFRVVAVAVLQFFADEIVAAVEARHYAGRAEQARALPFSRDLANSLRGVGRTLAVNALAAPVAALLAFTAIGPGLVFLAVNAVLLGRELTDMAWLRHCGETPDRSPVPRAERVMLGAVIVTIMLVPLVNLLAPILGAAAETHLTHRAMDKIAEQEGKSA
jgi:uncharacterized protein involved in cysteine biosynthesis